MCSGRSREENGGTAFAGHNGFGLPWETTFTQGVVDLFASGGDVHAQPIGFALFLQTMLLQRHIQRARLASGDSAVVNVRAMLALPLAAMICKAQRVYYAIEDKFL